MLKINIVAILFVFASVSAGFFPSVSWGWQWNDPVKVKKQYHKLVDEYFDEYFKYNPTQATSDGFHQYDDRLEDYSKKEIQEEVRFYKGILNEFKKIPSEKLGSDDAIDLELMMANINSNILADDKIRMWEKNPDMYSSGASGSAFSIMSRTFASPEVRLKSLIAREKLMPRIFVAARSNLKNPPRIYTEVALDQIPDIVSFFKKDVVDAFKDVKDPKLKKDFEASNAKVIDELEKYGKWVKEVLLPKSKGDFRIGTDNFKKKLLYEEMVDEPLDHLLDVGMANLRANQEAFKETAAKVDPTKTPQAILEDLVKDHPSADKLLGTVKDTLAGLKQYLEDKKIVTVPSPVLPIVQETPPFERALTMASMDTPGPYETVAKEAYFNVTLPEADWSKDRIEEHLEGFNRGTIISTAVHEAYPGHYIQFLWLQSVKSKVRKLLGCGSNSEGWAHYTEQMMLDEGYGGGDPKLRLGQLQDALLRNARYIVGIKMHTGDMTYDQGVDFFVKEGYQSRANAERETKRGTSDPTYLMYTLGKLEILKLREDYKALKGEKFSLQEFHDNFLKQGFPPLKLARRAMFGKDGPMLPDLKSPP